MAHCETFCRLQPVWITDECYLLPTLVSILSFTEHLPLPAILKCPQSQFLQIASTIASLDRSITVAPYPPDPAYVSAPLGDVIDNRLTRFAVCAAAPAILLVDSDTAFTEGIKALSPIVARGTSEPVIYGVVEYDSALDAYLYFSPRNNNTIPRYLTAAEKGRCYSSIFGKQWRRLLSRPQPNNGLLVFQNSSRLCAKWRLFYERGLGVPSVNPEDDQVPLAAAIGSSDCRLVRLDNRFNSLGAVNGNFAMFHPYAGLWRDEVRAALSTLPNVSDYASIVRSVLGYIPASLLDEFKLSPDEPCEYLSIPGFFEYPALYAEAVRRFRTGTFVELGTRKGKAACYLAELLRMSGTKDKFTSIDSYSDALSFDAMCRNFGDRGLLDYVRLLDLAREAACNLFADGSIDFLFVGGNRSYEEVWRDLEMWLPKIRPEGIIAGDYYTHSESVSCAVNDFAAVSNLVLETREPCFRTVKRI